MPVKSTSFGTITNDTETQNFSGNGTDSTIMKFDFMAVLGDSECTTLVLSDLKSGCDAMKIDLQMGQFCLSDICKANGKRLINPKLFSFTIENTSTSDVKFIIDPIETGLSELSIFNEIGEKVDNIKLVFNTFEKKEISYNSNYLSTGLYFVIFKSESMLNTKKLMIIK